jgi:uncharacterized DUF497 family protein
VIDCSGHLSSVLEANVGTTFEWDESKAQLNLDKLGISFEEAATVFEDPLSLTIVDQAHTLSAGIQAT